MKNVKKNFVYNFKLKNTTLMIQKPEFIEPRYSKICNEIHELPLKRRKLN